jgi:hypothetical protein
MIALIVFCLLSVGALATFLIPPQRRALHILIAFIPAAAAGALFLRLPLSDSFSLPWSPSALFPDPLMFRAGPASVSFAVYFCCLLALIEWTRPLRQSPGRSSRLAIYLLVLSGIAACFASNPIAVIVAWSLMDFLSFLAMLFIKSPVEIGPGGISSSLPQSMGVFAVNTLGNVLVVFSLFLGTPGSVLDWSIPWGISPLNLSPIFFLSGILFRVLLTPLQFTFSRLPITSAGTEILLRIITPATGLCLLANIWPTQPLPSGAGLGFSWAAIPLVVLLLAAGWQWCIASSAFGRRDFYFLFLPSFALLSAIVYPQSSAVFTASGGMLILGGGILMVYVGYLAHRRWMAAFPVVLGIMLAGIPYSPMSAWSAEVYPGLFSLSGLPLLLPLALSQIFAVCALFRLAFESVDEFPSNEPILLFAFSAGMGVGLLGLLFPAWHGIDSIGSVAAPLLWIAAGVLLIFLLRRFQRTGASVLPVQEKTFRLEWMQRVVVFSFQKTAVLVSGVESFLSGEGAMLWSLGIALLLYLVFRGG